MRERERASWVGEGRRPRRQAETQGEQPGPPRARALAASAGADAFSPSLPPPAVPAARGLQPHRPSPTRQRRAPPPVLVRAPRMRQHCSTWGRAGHHSAVALFRLLGDGEGGRQEGGGSSRGTCPSPELRTCRYLLTDRLRRGSPARAAQTAGRRTAPRRPLPHPRGRK